MGLKRTNVGDHRCRGQKTKRLGWQFRDAFIAGVARLQKAGDDAQDLRQERSPKITAVQHRGQAQRSGHRAQPSNQNRHNRSDRRQSIDWKTCGKHVADAPASLLNLRQEKRNARIRISQTRRSDLAQRTIYPSVTLRSSWDRLLFVIWNAWPNERTSRDERIETELIDGFLLQPYHHYF